jgi:hypothetical protein
MTWWYISSPVLTCAVEVEDGKIIGGAPIVRRFVGQPAKSLGNWLRSHGDVTFEKLDNPFGYTFFWGNNPKRKELKGRRCRILVRGTMRSVLAEFDDGEKVICSFRALRKEKT